jgi:hypothetical protein
MRLEAFEDLVNRIVRSVPREYLNGVAAIDVSPRTVPNPEHPDVFTLGECVPMGTGADEEISRIVLYHGSFRAVAQLDSGFDWEGETRETLLHEVRHHLEWKARADDLEAYDWAVAQNHLRLDGKRYDLLFYQAGERLAADVYQVEDDVFFERVVRDMPPEIAVTWQGCRYVGAVKPSSLPALVALEGLAVEPSGEVYVVLRRKPRLFDLFRTPTPPQEQRIRVRPIR